MNRQPPEKKGITSTSTPCTPRRSESIACVASWAVFLFLFLQHDFLKGSPHGAARFPETRSFLSPPPAQDGAPGAGGPGHSAGGVGGGGDRGRGKFQQRRGEGAAPGGRPAPGPAAADAARQPRRPHLPLPAAGSRCCASCDDLCLICGSGLKTCLSPLKQLTGAGPRPPFPPAPAPPAGGI